MHLQLKLFFLIKIREIRNFSQLFFEWSRKNDPNRLQFSRLSFNHNPFRFNIVFIPDTKPIYGHETRENDKLGTKLHSPPPPPPVDTKVDAKIARRWATDPYPPAVEI